MKKQLIIFGIVLILLAVGLSGCNETQETQEEKDTDGDGYNDDVDYFPQNADEWADSDGDNIGDNADAFPNNASEWIDSDSDGYGDNTDDFPNDSTLYLKELMNSSYQTLYGDDDNISLNVGTIDYDDGWYLKTKYIVCECHLDTAAGYNDSDFPLKITFDYTDWNDMKRVNSFFVTEGDSVDFELSSKFEININEDTPLNMTISKVEGFEGHLFTFVYSIYQLK